MDNQIFVKIDEYNEVLNTVRIVKERITKAQKTIENINELKIEEDKEIDNWNKNLDLVTKSVAEIEETLKKNQ
ncbi:MAG: hypothetical protein ABIB43_05530 [archaeon]